MRVALVVTQLGFGGGEGAVLRLAKALGDAGHEATVFALHGGQAYSVAPQMKLIRLGFAQRNRFGAIGTWWQAARLGSAIRSAAADRPFDLLISNLNAANRLVALAGVPHAKYYVRNNLEMEAAYARRPHRHRRKFHAILDGKDLLCVSRQLADDLVQSGYIRPRRIDVVRNVLDADDICARSELPDPAIPAGDFILHIGRFARQKRHDLLFDALARIERPLHLVLLTDEPTRALALAGRHPLRHHRVSAFGFQDNPYNWMRRSRLVVNCSDYEGVSNVMLEAAVLGTPVVATRCRYGPEEVLMPENARFLVPPGDARALAARIAWVLEEGPRLLPPTVLKETEPAHVVRQLEQLVGENARNTAEESGRHDEAS